MPLACGRNDLPDRMKSAMLKPRGSTSSDRTGAAMLKFPDQKGPPHQTPWYWERVSLFDGVEASAKELFLRHATMHSYRRGQHVFREDDDANQVFYLHEGMTRIYRLSPDGDLTVYWFCIAGELFGAGGITGCRNQAVNSQAITKSTVYVMLRPVFEQMLTLHPKIAYNALKLMGARLRLACDTIVDMRSQKTNTRVALALLRLSHNCGVHVGNAVKIDAPITHQEIANMVGACRQTVTEVLRELEGNGLVRQEGRQLLITNVAALNAFALAAN